MQDILAWKKQIRNEMKERRQKMTSTEVEQLSGQVRQRLEELNPIQNARSIMAYASINNEIDLVPLMVKWHEEGRTILLPRVEDNGRMEAVKWTGWDQIKSGPFGIREPLGEPFDPALIDVVLTPGLVFDYKGYRLGYGKGYYDRFLPRLSNSAFICGIGYEFQVIENVYPHEGDIPMHWIVTDHSELVIDWNYF
ncbi:MAG: 5-formyltetrahydrofolate cyclo-ligase [Syntrophomonadaceae bacterium]|jgi:5-formyltetrahydrofolate cyclo-ligase|nr:5-formyltetrahydrofolate cyclo-ligase [Bacillota bacterium]NLM89241.1 5-formyltetrahydrofolate cyclo-ligase [Syntrophomonadaceae bacterium]HAA08579.1 5-formyltetrahydrofolate cyclo-ligase [Syntrophomonas sp.]HQD91608.1 5-formyltetrahydrofolate cyclo-ligase [Syntrophomonadaceae bacterium]